MASPTTVGQAHEYNYGTRGTSGGSGLGEPSGAASGDRHFVDLIVEASASSITPPAGWGTQGVDWQLVDSSLIGSTYRALVYEVVRGGSATSFAFTWTGASWHDLLVDTKRGTKAGLSTESYALNTPSSTGAQPDPAQVTPTTNDTLILTFGRAWRGFLATVSAPSGYTLGFPGTGQAAHASASKAIGTAAAEDPSAWGNGVSGSGWNDAITIVIASQAAGGGSDPVLPRSETAAEPSYADSVLRRAVNVAALVAVASSGALPPKLRRSLPEHIVEESRIKRPLRSPQSVDDPCFLLWALIDEPAPPELVQRARRMSLGGSVAATVFPPGIERLLAEQPTEERVQRRLRRLPESVDAPPLKRELPVCDTPPEDLVARLRGRAPESVDAPPIPRLRAISDTPAEELVARLHTRAPESVDQPLLRRVRVIADWPLEDYLPRRELKLPDALITPVDQPPAPRWRTISDTPREDVRSARGRWVLPSGAAPPPDQPLARWRTAVDLVPEEGRIRLLRRLPESVDQPLLRRPARANEPLAEEARIRLEPCQAWAIVQGADQPPLLLRRSPLDALDGDLPGRRLRRFPESVDAPPLVRWRNVYDTAQADLGARHPLRLPESFVPPPVDNPPQARWRTISDTPLEELRLRRLRLVLESGPAPAVYVDSAVHGSSVLGDVVFRVSVR